MLTPEVCFCTILPILLHLQHCCTSAAVVYTIAGVQTIIPRTGGGKWFNKTRYVNIFKTFLFAGINQAVFYCNGFCACVISFGFCFLL